MLRWPLQSTFALFPVLQLRGLVLWESHGRYFIIGRFFWDLFGALSCRFWSIAQQSGAQLPTHTLNYWTELSGVLVFQLVVCNLAHRRSVAYLLMLFKIKSNPMHPLSGALPLPYVPARVTLGALVAHRYSFAPPRCWTSQYSRIFVPLSVSLWNDLSDPVFDGVGLAGFKSRANAFLLAWFPLSLVSPTILSSSSAFHGLVVWVGVFGLIECCHSLPALHSGLQIIIIIIIIIIWNKSSRVLKQLSS